MINLAIKLHWFPINDTRRELATLYYFSDTAFLKKLYIFVVSMHECSTGFPKKFFFHLQVLVYLWLYAMIVLTPNFPAQSIYSQVELFLISSHNSWVPGQWAFSDDPNPTPTSICLLHSHRWAPAAREIGCEHSQPLTAIWNNPESVSSNVVFLAPLELQYPERLHLNVGPPIRWSACSPSWHEDDRLKHHHIKPSLRVMTRPIWILNLKIDSTPAQTWKHIFCQKNAPSGVMCFSSALTFKTLHIRTTKEANNNGLPPWCCFATPSDRDSRWILTSVFNQRVQLA